MSDLRALEDTMPLWLLEYLLTNKVPAVPVQKISFVLLPWPDDEETLPELLNTWVHMHLLRSTPLIGLLVAARSQNLPLAASYEFANLHTMYVSCFKSAHLLQLKHRPPGARQIREIGQEVLEFIIPRNPTIVPRCQDVTCKP